MTTTAAEKVAGPSGEKEKEKVEKRRALGRGLESLLPGPRVVAGTATRPGDTPAPGPGSTVGTRAGVPAPQETQEVPIEGTIQAVADRSAKEATQARAPSTVAQGRSAPYGLEAAELRAAGQPEAAVPTSNSSQPSASGEPITIMAPAESRGTGNLVVQLAIEDIDKNPFQTRYVGNDEALEELTNSIKANGVLQPILVRPAEEEGRYILILGERRLHASKIAGKKTIPAMVRRVSEQQAAEMTIIENLQREDLSPLEQAEAFRLLSEGFKLTQAQIGERVGLSRESVANYMRLLRLPREVMQLLIEKKIKFAEARELLKLEDHDKIKEAALYAVKKGMTVEQVEMLVMRMQGWLAATPGMPGQEKQKGMARWVDPNVRAAQMELERLLGVRVRIRDRKGKGKIVIEYSTVDDYERIVTALRGK